MRLIAVVFNMPAILLALVVGAAAAPGGGNPFPDSVDGPTIDIGFGTK